MGFFGGSAQSTNSIMNNIEFAPNIQFGDGNDSAVRKETGGQTSTVTPKLDDSIGVAASVGVLGGSGGPASFSRAQDDVKPVNTSYAKPVLDGASNTALYIGLGVALLGGGLFIYSTKKKSA